MDGMTICRKIREVSDVPIIILTAKESESDQVLGLEMGADDYVTKPFSPLTLMARIKAVTRRKNSATSTENNEDILETTYFKISKRTREIFIKVSYLTHLRQKNSIYSIFDATSTTSVFKRTIAGTSLGLSVLWR